MEMTEKRLTDLEICKEIRETTEEMIQENNFSLREIVERINNITDRLIDLDKERDDLETDLINLQGVLIAMVYQND